MRILLVQPPEGRGLGLHYLARVEPLGLESVAGGLAGHDVRLLDLRVEGGLVPALDRFRPDLCGIACSFTMDLYQALAVAEAVRAHGAPGRPFIVVGGHHASLNPGDLAVPAVDAVAVGEGERTLADLVACLERGQDPRSVPGLVLNTPAGQLRTARRELEADLDKLSPPARFLTQAHRHQYFIGVDRPAAVIETARGCPYRCNFCSVWIFYRGRCRTKSPERVAAEVAATRESYVLFSDDNFLLDVDRARRIAEVLRERALRRRFAFQARSDAIVAHPDVIQLWRTIGLESVFIGIEKIDDAGLLGVNKDNSVANNERALTILRAEGVAVSASFIVDPAWQRADFAALRRYIASRRIKTPSFTVLTPLPGTLLYKRLRNELQYRNYELFDLLHAVVPTLLPLPEFYVELAGLYRAAYSRQRVLTEAVSLLWRGLSWRTLSLAHLRGIIGAAGALTAPERYLAGHRL